MYRLGGVVGEHGGLFGNVLGIYYDRLYFVVGDNRTALDHYDAVAEVADEMMLVGDHYDGGAALVNFVEQRNDFIRHIGVDVSGGLVGKYHGGIVNEGTGKSHTLLFTARKLGGIASGLFGEAHDVQRVGNSAAYLPLEAPTICMAKATFSNTVLSFIRRKSWKTMPMVRRVSGHRGI